MDIVEIKIRNFTLDDYNKDLPIDPKVYSYCQMYTITYETKDTHTLYTGWLNENFTYYIVDNKFREIKDDKFLYELMWKIDWRFKLPKEDNLYDLLEYIDLSVFNETYTKCKSCRRVKHIKLCKLCNKCKEYVCEGCRDGQWCYSCYYKVKY